MCDLPVCLSTRVTLAFTGVGLLVFLTSLIGLLPNGRYSHWQACLLNFIKDIISDGWMCIDKIHICWILLNCITSAVLTYKLNCVTCSFLQDEKLSEWKSPFDVLQNMRQSSDGHHNLSWQVKELQCFYLFNQEIFCPQPLTDKKKMVKRKVEHDCMQKHETVKKCNHVKRN